jgi:hypothetical protein
VASTDEHLDDQREVPFGDFAEDLVILPDDTANDSDVAWVERRTGNDDRLLAERPPHWD